MSTPARALLSLCLLMGLVAGCGTGAGTSDPVLAIDAPSDNVGLAWSMAADAIGGDLGRDGAVVIVPSDDALLDLDADALADLLATNRLGGMIEDSVIRAGFDADVEAGDIYLMTNGDSIFVTEVGGRIHLNDHPLVETTMLGTATVLVVDGVVVGP